MSDVTIRPATDADMPAVARIWREGVARRPSGAVAVPAHRYEREVGEE